MALRTPRLLLAFASLLSALGGAIHAAAFRKAQTVITASDLPRFYGGSSKGLWLADSATLFILALIFVLVAARPSTASRSLLMLVALIPAATAVMLYAFLGSFFAGHLLLAIAALAFLGGLLLPRELGQSRLDKAQRTTA